MERWDRESQQPLGEYKGWQEIKITSHWGDDGPESITDPEERKWLTEYFYQNLSYAVFKGDVERRKFESFRDVIMVCKMYGIPCPPWFMEKYSPFM